VDDGKEMLWILALIWQNRGPGEYAAAWGTGSWANGKTQQWHCQTTMVGANSFEAGAAKPGRSRRSRTTAECSSAGPTTSRSCKPTPQPLYLRQKLE
jgi:hypothetical protein